MLGFVSNELPAGWDAVPFQSNYSGRNLQQALNMPTPPPPRIVAPVSLPLLTDHKQEALTLSKACHS